ncbi:MAG: hypothetical protein MUD02_06385 [Bacteroidales bacterium]|jgi:hypothetical protein|nr:hypothetical protein [Bacteroidales bacterium]MCU0408559.1 hypothetical protein [Bacteroidales bacterium]
MKPDLDTSANLSLFRMNEAIQAENFLHHFSSRSGMCQTGMNIRLKSLPAGTGADFVLA